LTKEELQKIIDQFDENDLKNRAIFGIAQYGGGSDESFIRANKEGLELFAIELLKSARDTNEIISSNRRNSIPLDYNENWIDENSDTFIQYIELITEKRKKKPNNDHTTKFADKLIPYGCGLILIVVLISIIVGLVTIFKWLN
jgi:hypothetical protein